MVKKRWQLFEEYSLKFLQTKYPGYTFNKIGGSNSKMGDIQVFNHPGTYLYDIEVKLSPCQAGQFALSYENEAYSYSFGNNLSENKYCSQIIAHINANLEIYNQVSQKGIPITIDDKILYSYLVKHFKDKNVNYILSAKSLNGDMHLFPIEELQEHFQIEALFRKKKSGSRKLPKKDYYSVKDILTSDPTLLNGETIIGNEIIYTTEKPLENTSLYFGKKFYFSEINPNTYKVRKLSNTNNPNVIFKLKLKHI